MELNEDQKAAIKAKIQEAAPVLSELLTAAASLDPATFFGSYEKLLKIFPRQSAEEEKAEVGKPWDLPLTLQLPMIYAHILLIEQTLEATGVFDMVRQLKAQQGNPSGLVVARDVPRMPRM